MKLPGALLAACGLAGLLLLRRPVNYSLADKVVVITGGSRGLGLALAREFSRHGAKVALLARDREELERAATDLRSLRRRGDNLDVRRAARPRRGGDYLGDRA